MLQKLSSHADKFQFYVPRYEDDVILSKMSTPQYSCAKQTMMNFKTNDRNLSITTHESKTMNHVLG